MDRCQTVEVSRYFGANLDVTFGSDKPCVVLIVKLVPSGGGTQLSAPLRICFLYVFQPQRRKLNWNFYGKDFIKCLKDIRMPKAIASGQSGTSLEWRHLRNGKIKR